MTDINAPIAFDINDAAIAEVRDEFKDIDAYKDLDEAKSAKKVLVKMRSKLSEAHKQAKAEALAFGRRCDAEKNRLLDQIKEIEDPITEQLDEIKNAEARKEQERLDKIEAAMDRIAAHANDRYSLTLDELKERMENAKALEITAEEFWERTEEATLLKSDVILKLRIATEAEEKRLEEEAEKERIKKAYLELREKLAKQEEENRQREEKERKEREAAEAAERERREEEHRKELEEARKREEAERKERERLEAEAAERERQEREEQEAKERLRLAPDTEKLEAYANELEDWRRAAPEMETNEGTRVMALAQEKLAAVVDYLNNEARKMK